MRSQKKKLRRKRERSTAISVFGTYWYRTVGIRIRCYTCRGIRQQQLTDTPLPHPIIKPFNAWWCFCFGFHHRPCRVDQVGCWRRDGTGVERALLIVGYFTGAWWLAAVTADDDGLSLFIGWWKLIATHGPIMVYPSTAAAVAAVAASVWIEVYGMPLTSRAIEWWMVNYFFRNLAPDNQYRSVQSGSN